MLGVLRREGSVFPSGEVRNERTLGSCGGKAHGVVSWLVESCSVARVGGDAERFRLLGDVLREVVGGLKRCGASMLVVMVRVVVVLRVL